MEVARDYPAIHEIEVSSDTDAKTKLDLLRIPDDSIPLFYKNNNGEMNILTTDYESLDFDQIALFSYIGKEFKFDDVTS